MTTFRAAAIQMRSTRSVETNIADAEELVRAAVAAGADYVLTPEMTNLVERDRARLMAVTTEEQDDPTLARMAEVAKELGIWLHLGSLAVKTPEGKAANRAFLLGPDGALKARYDKIHLFDVDLPNGESWRESRTYDGGAEAVVTDLPWIRLGFSICYDLRFPLLFNALAKAGAGMIAIPAAFTRQTGEAHWQVLQRARAIETGSFVIAAAQGGKHEDGRETYGHSLVIDPWGRVLVEADADEPGFVIAEIDPGAVTAARARIPAIANERPFAVPARPVEEVAS